METVTAALRADLTSAHADPPEPDDDVVSPGRPRLPPAAARAEAERASLAALFALTLLSAVDGSLLALAAAGRLTSLADSVTVGLVVVAGAGSWLAANQAFAGRRRAGADWAALGLLGVLTLEVGLQWTA